MDWVGEELDGALLEETVHDGLNVLSGNRSGSRELGYSSGAPAVEHLEDDSSTIR